MNSYKIRKLEAELKHIKKNESNSTSNASGTNTVNNSYVQDLEEKVQQLEYDIGVLQATKQERFF